MLRIRNVSQSLFRLAVALMLLSALAIGQAHAQQRIPGTGFVPRVFKDESGEHKYQVFVPHAYTPAKKWPVILFLHGAGERGTDGILPTQYGLGPLVRLRESNFPFIVVFPQAERGHQRILTAWNPDSPDGARALRILEQVEKTYSIDAKREILTGWSMGGYGAWKMAAAFPERWLSVVPISSGGDESEAEKLKNVPIWAFHGARDRIVSPSQSQKMVEAVKAAGGQPRYTEPADGDHNVWRVAYDDDSLYAWMLNPKGDPARLARVTWRPAVPAGQPPAAIPEPPFIPALELPRAGYVRLGNEMLAALADTIPRIVGSESLTGRLNDISDWAQSESGSFSVYMSGLSYRAQLVGANVKAYRKDRLNIQLGLSNAQITISGTSLEGQISAEAGPISIVLGHQRPIWISFDVTPEVVNRRLKFRHVGTTFAIPDDNWYVSGPAGVSTSGTIFARRARSEVSEGLVSGLYGKKHMIEQKMVTIIPRVIAQLEKKFNEATEGRTISGIWPLPVYQPQLRVWPAEVTTDETGVSLLLGATAAAVDPLKPPKQVRTVAPLGPAIAAVGQSTKLQAGLVPQTLTPISQLLVEADLARIQVGDMGSKALAKFSKPDVLAEMVPDLKRYGPQVQIWSELVLSGPIHLADVSGKGLVLELSQFKILIEIKTDPASAGWKPYAEFEATIRQAIVPKLVKPTEATRAAALGFDGDPEIEVKGRFAEGYQPEDGNIDLARLKTLVTDAWAEFFGSTAGPETEIPDLDLGFDKLRVQDVAWKTPHLVATFGPPGVKITNSSDKPLVYETKGPYSGWGGPYTLKPGQVHAYPITYPMIFRRRVGNTYQMFTLPVGSHSEFRVKVPGTPESLYKAREPAEIEKAVENLPPPPEKK